MKKLFLGAIVGVVSTVVYQKYLAEKAAPYVEKCKEHARKAYETARTKLHTLVPDLVVLSSGLAFRRPMPFQSFNIMLLLE